MSMKTFLFFCVLAPLGLFASSAAGEVETDIVERIINFVMFVGILYYLLANRIKEFFVQRKDDIASELEKVQQRLKETKKLKEEAESKLQNAKKMAEEIVASAKKEAVLIREKAEETKKQDLDNIARSYRENMELEKKKAQREVVREIMGELFEEGGMQMDNEGYAQIVLKKVA